MLTTIKDHISHILWVRTLLIYICFYVSNIYFLLMIVFNNWIDYWRFRNISRFYFLSDDNMHPIPILFNKYSTAESKCFWNSCLALGAFKCTFHLIFCFNVFFIIFYCRVSQRFLVYISLYMSCLGAFLFAIKL